MFYYLILFGEFWKHFLQYFDLIFINTTQQNTYLSVSCLYIKLNDIIRYFLMLNLFFLFVSIFFTFYQIVGLNYKFFMQKFFYSTVLFGFLVTYFYLLLLSVVLVIAYSYCFQSGQIILMYIFFLQEFYYCLVFEKEILKKGVFKKMKNNNFFYNLEKQNKRLILFGFLLVCLVDFFGYKMISVFFTVGYLNCLYVRDVFYANAAGAVYLRCKSFYKVILVLIAVFFFLIFFAALKKLWYLSFLACIEFLAYSFSVVNCGLLVLLIRTRFDKILFLQYFMNNKIIVEFFKKNDKFFKKMIFLFIIGIFILLYYLIYALIYFLSFVACCIIVILPMYICGKIFGKINFVKYFTNNIIRKVETLNGMSLIYLVAVNVLMAIVNAIVSILVF